MESPIPELNRLFSIPGTAELVEGNGGLPKVRVTSPQARGEMYLHGAHVTSWTPADGDEVLFLSSQSRWEDGRAIRGGVPISFPWFADKAGDPTAPAHGFVRTKAWLLQSITQAGGNVTVSMLTESDESTKKWWPADFRLVHRVTFGSELSLELLVTNTGTIPLRFEEALHAYYRVGDVEKTAVQGLDAVDYLDKTDGNQKKLQRGEILISSETDRVYLNTRGAVELNDSLLRRCIRVAKQNSGTTVVWNPWAEKAHAMADLGDGGWRQMVCIETSNVSDFAVNLAPGEQHSMRAIVSVAVM